MHLGEGRQTEPFSIEGETLRSMWLFPLQLVGIHVGVEGLQIHGRGEEIALSVLAVRGKVMRAVKNPLGEA